MKRRVRGGTPEHCLTLAERFWKRVVRREGQCWEWIGQINRNGYGIFRNYSDKSHPQTVSASRFSLTLHTGPPPQPKSFCCHSCLSRSCVNPEHLFWADQPLPVRSSPQIDSKTLYRKNKLDADDVAKIRQMYATRTFAQKDLARCFGVTQACISDVVLSEGPDATPAAVRYQNRTRLSDATVRAIRRLARDGLTHTLIGSWYEISHEYVGQIVRRVKRADVDD